MADHEFVAPLNHRHHHQLEKNCAHPQRRQKKNYCSRVTEKKGLLRSPSSPPPHHTHTAPPLENLPYSICAIAGVARRFFLAGEQSPFHAV